MLPGSQRLKLLVMRTQARFLGPLTSNTPVLVENLILHEALYFYLFGSSKIFLPRTAFLLLNVDLPVPDALQASNKNP